MNDIVYASKLRKRYKGLSQIDTDSIAFRINSLEQFMIKVSKKLNCLPDFTDPENENDHILRKLDEHNKSPWIKIAEDGSNLPELTGYVIARKGKYLPFTAMFNKETKQFTTNINEINHVTHYQIIKEPED